MRGSFLVALALSSMVCGCSALGSLRARADRPPKPTPANALSDEAREPSLGDPLAIGSGDDAIVRVVADGFACTGTLISDSLVLTAHHCVARRDDAGDVLAEDVAPGRIRIELGGDHLPWGEAGVRAVIAPPCGHGAGFGDIAILVLSEPLADTPALTPRLDGAPREGESVVPVGFGRCALSTDGIRRRVRAGGSIDFLADARFRLDASICPGDSGGPALGPDGDVVGVISASAMDSDEETRGRTEFTRLDAWRAVFATAKLVADGQSVLELPPVDGCTREPRSGSDPR